MAVDFDFKSKERDNMLSVGIIGLGKMGRLHMMNCLHIDNVKIEAAADRSKTALNKAKSIGVKKLYTDYHDLLNDALGLDAVIIALPNFLHFDCVRSALEAGLDVFVEKPLARNVEECRRIVKLVKSTGKKLMIGHSMRYVNAIEEMKNVAEKGHIGRIEVVTIEEILNGPFSHGIVPSPVAEWWFDPEKSGGGALIDLGYHMIDLFRFFAGDSKVIFSSLDHKFNLPIEDGAIVILESLDSITKGIINVGWYQQMLFPNVNFRLILHGNAGYLSSEDRVPRNLYLHAAKECAKNVLRRIAGRRIRPLSYTYYYESHFKELKNFFDCLKHNSDPIVSAMDGLRTVELIEEAYRISKNHETSDRD